MLKTFTQNSNQGLLLDIIYRVFFYFGYKTFIQAREFYCANKKCRSTHFETRTEKFKFAYLFLRLLLQNVMMSRQLIYFFFDL